MHAPDLPHVAHLPVAADHPVAEVVGLGARDSRVDPALHCCAVIRMHMRDDAVITGGEGLRLGADDPVDLVRPPHLPCGDLPGPGANVRKLLRLGQDVVLVPDIGERCRRRAAMQVLRITHWEPLPPQP